MSLYCFNSLHVAAESTHVVNATIVQSTLRRLLLTPHFIAAFQNRYLHDSVHIYGFLLAAKMLEH